MTNALSLRFGRPSWMIPFGGETLGDMFFDRLLPEWRRDLGEEWNPSVNIFEKDGKYHLSAELPGLKREDISVSVDDDIVTISGKKESKSEEEGADYYVKETRSGSFSRSFRLQREIAGDKIEASYKDGVLSVVMPCKEDSKPKRIEVH